MTDELRYLPATEALARFRSRELSPVELMEAVIERARHTEPTVNALCHTFYDRALTQAQAAERAYLNGTARPLEGIPLALKEEEAVQGEPWTQGSLIHEHTVADYTSEFARRQLDAGAIVHARSTAPEFSCAGFTHSRIHGVTRNPHNPQLAVGGSSGGSAASLAAGSTTLASGSDIGGSIRMPAAACGVVGYKPPYGRVPCDPPYNLDTYCHCGPLARTVADCALYENVLAGVDPEDIVSLRSELLLPERFTGIDGMRIALSLELGGDWTIDDDVRANTLAVADALRAAGADVDEVDLVIPYDVVTKAISIHFHQGFAADIGEAVRAHPDLVCDYTGAMVEASERLADGGTVAEGLRLEAELYRPLGRLLTRYDALVLPTSRIAGLDAGDGYADHAPVAGGTQLEFYLGNFFTPVFNIFSRCPVLAVPSGFGARNAPTGVQIAGRTYDDLTVFRIGAALEAVRPWDTRPAVEALAA
ncbi:MAG TPA: amidase [Solirubrobacteraceae bacterium]|nr:amidase [Solirubrobacteraceae bacterium]